MVKQTSEFAVLESIEEHVNVMMRPAKKEEEDHFMVQDMNMVVDQDESEEGRKCLEKHASEFTTLESEE